MKRWAIPPACGLAIAASLLAVCRRPTELRVAEVGPLCLSEDDTLIVPAGPLSGWHFLEGFAAPGDDGRTMRGTVAAIRFDAVSDGGRLLSLEVATDSLGGELLVEGPHGETLVSGIVRSSGVVTAPFARGSLERGQNRVRLRWRPSDGQARAAPTIRRAWLDPLEGTRFSAVTVDTLGDKILVDGGASAELFVVPGRSAVLRSRVSGRGTAALILNLEGDKERILWHDDVTTKPIDVTVRIPGGRDGMLAGIEFQTVGEGTIEWRDIRLCGVTVPRWLKSEDEPPARGQPEPFLRWNVLLYLVDTVRRDHLQVYGYSRPTTPHLAERLDEWAVWEDCQSLSSWTRPSTATLLTGLDPMRHGAIGESDSLCDGRAAIWEPYRQQGHEVAYFTTNSHVTREWGFARDVDEYVHFVESPDRRTIHLPADSLHRAFLAWLDHRSNTRPFFAYLHASDPHGPYTPPLDLISAFYPAECPRKDALSIEELSRMVCPGRVEPWERRAAEALYDAEIAGWERQFSRLLNELESRGILDSTVIILTSDHGEEFGEHGSFSHGLTLYREQVEVPLLVRIPGVAGSRRTEPLDHRDVTELLDAVMTGHDIHTWVPPLRPARLAHLSLRGIEKARLQTDEFVLIWNTRPVGACDGRQTDFELFAGDDQERDDVSGHHTVLCRVGTSALRAWIASAPTPASRHLSLDAKAGLRLLGYVMDE